MEFGVPVLFAVLIVGALGVPFLPTSLMMVAAGAFVRQGDMNGYHVLPVALLGVVLGDNLGYWLGRGKGQDFLTALTRRFGGGARVERAERLVRERGGAAIFVTRWLLASLGPWINLSCGASGYPWRRFLGWDLLGQLCWVSLYSGLGYAYSDRVQAIAELMRDIFGVVASLVLAAVIGYQLGRTFFAPK